MYGICYIYIRVAKKLRNQQRIQAKKMRLGEKQTVNISEKSIERNRALNAPKVYRIMVHLRTCPTDSHMCSVVNRDINCVLLADNGGSGATTE